jgi:hypothetical protein
MFNFGKLDGRELLYKTAYFESYSVSHLKKSKSLTLIQFYSFLQLIHYLTARSWVFLGLKSGLSFEFSQHDRVNFRRAYIG